MPASNLVSRLLPFALAMGWILGGCLASPPPAATPTRILPPTAVFTRTASPSIEATLVPRDSGWQALQPGLERRLMRVYDDHNQPVEWMYLLRLDQALFRLDVAYSETPKSLAEWQSASGAAVILNGGYFRIEEGRYLPNGLTISGGKRLGSSYEGFGGMVAIRAQGTEVRGLAKRPYDPGEALLAALQSFPLLVKAGGKIGFPQEYEDGLQARRTVIAQDLDGKLLFIVTPQGYFTLHRLSAYLTASDLRLDVALNLDGGPSSGILVKDTPSATIPAQSPLPVVIVAYPR